MKVALSLITKVTSEPLIAETVTDVLPSVQIKEGETIKVPPKFCTWSNLYSFARRVDKTVSSFNIAVASAPSILGNVSPFFTNEIRLEEIVGEISPPL